jgi:4-oxalocrotonate tautomerase
VSGIQTGIRGATLNCGEGSVSVAIEDIEPADWAEKVYQADIVSNWEKLHKKSGYHDVKEELSRRGVRQRSKNKSDSHQRR